MSALSQFFGGGGSGTTSSLPAKVLIVDGGSGFTDATSNYFSPLAACYTYGKSGGVGGLVIDSDISVLRGVTCPIGIGTGGKSMYCCWYTSSATPYTSSSILCYIGAPGKSSNFGSLGTCNGAPITSCCPTICVCTSPYFKTPVLAGGVLGNCTSLTVPICPAAAYFSGMYGTAPPAFCNVGSGSVFVADGNSGPPAFPPCSYTGYIGNGCSRFSGRAFPAYNIMKGRAGNPSPYYNFVPGGSTTVVCTGITLSSYGAYISDITGCVCAYGRGGSGCSFTNVVAFPPSSNYVFLNAHTDNFIGSGAGAHYVAGCPYPGNTPCGIPGSVTVQYPTDFGVATTSSPCVFDCSPQTPGFRTYRFLCPGSITFP